MPRICIYTYVHTHTHRHTHIRNTHVPFIMAHHLLCATLYMYVYICTCTHTKHVHIYETHTHHSSWRSACPVLRRRRARRWLPDVPSHSAGPPRWCSCGSPPWPSHGATPAVCVPAVDVQIPKYTPTQVYIHTKVNLVQLQQSALRACCRRPSSYVNRYTDTYTKYVHEHIFIWCKSGSLHACCRRACSYSTHTDINTQTKLGQLQQSAGVHMYL